MKHYKNKDIASLLYDLSKDKDKDESQNNQSLNLNQVIKFLYSKGYLKKSKNLLSEIDNVFASNDGRLNVEVSVKERLSDLQKNELKSVLKNKFNVSDVWLFEKVDQRIIGGLKVKVGEMVFDNTIKTN